MFAGLFDTLADFGLSPRKVAVVSPEARVAAVAKTKATRAARHTMGAKQKKAIQGDVTGVLITPITPSTSAGATTTASATQQVPAPSPVH